jgi:lysyl-tRNA synthetase class I
LVLSYRAKEALAAKTKMEQELQALALQLETAVVRAQKCEENERAAEDVASRHKVSPLATFYMFYRLLCRALFC